jgi:hypothetical protein
MRTFALVFAILAVATVAGATVLSKLDLVRIGYKSRASWDAYAAFREDTALLEARTAELLRADRLEATATKLRLRVVRKEERAPGGAKDAPRDGGRAGATARNGPGRAAEPRIGRMSE